MNEKYQGYETEKVKLRRGLYLKGVCHREAVVRELSAADVYDTSRPGLTPDQMQMERLARSVVYVGDIEGPLSMDVLGLMTADDSGRLNGGLVKIDERLEAWSDEEPEESSGKAPNPKQLGATSSPALLS